MTYNTDPRRGLKGKRQRAAFLEAHYFTCYFCGGYITDKEWDDEHVEPKEMMPPGSNWNAWTNRRPIHRRPCHKTKTANDHHRIAASNRQAKTVSRRALDIGRPEKKPGKIPQRPNAKLQGPGFDKTKTRKFNGEVREKR